MKAEPLKVSLNTSTYTAVEVPTGYNLEDKFFPVSAYINPKGLWYISFESSPSDDKPVLEDNVYNNQFMKIDKDGAVFYAKASSGTPDLIVHIGRPHK